jgi:hypothetical protein
VSYFEIAMLSTDFRLKIRKNGDFGVYVRWIPTDFCSGWIAGASDDDPFYGYC